MTLLWFLIRLFIFTPTGAKFDLPPLKSGERRVWKLAEKDKLNPVSVKIGMIGSERIRYAHDLSAGDLVVVDSVSTKKNAQSSGLRLRF